MYIYFSFNFVCQLSKRARKREKEKRIVREHVYVYMINSESDAYWWTMRGMKYSCAAWMEARRTVSTHLWVILVVRFLILGGRATVATTDFAPVGAPFSFMCACQLSIFIFILLPLSIIDHLYHQRTGLV